MISILQMFQIEMNFICQILLITAAVRKGLIALIKFSWMISLYWCRFNAILLPAVI